MATDVKTSGVSKVVPKTPPKGKAGMSVLDFFNVPANRMDGWNDLNNAAVKLSHAKLSGRKTKALEDEVKGLLEFREVFESFWAYPGLALYKDVVDFLRKAILRPSQRQSTVSPAP
jgi:hypothetical protein